jgi:hypothetical protein
MLNSEIFKNFKYVQSINCGNFYSSVKAVLLFTDLMNA